MAKHSGIVKCPITSETLKYNGRGRPPVFSKNATAAQRREFKAGKVAK
jgi:hypothetical protein